MTIETTEIRDRKAWIARRRRDVTASEVAALFGKHPYKTALDLYMDKTGLNAQDTSDDTVLRRGRILEPAVAEAVKEIRPQWQISRSLCYFSKPELRIGGTPDWFVMDQENTCRVLETKTASPDIFEQQWNGTPPLAWILQTLVQMMVSDLDRGSIACLVTSFDFPVHIYDVERHKDAENAILEKVSEFWGMVKRGTPPDPDFTKDGASIAKMYPSATAPAVDWSNDDRAYYLADQYESLTQAITGLETKKDAVAAEIKAKLGEHESAMLPGWNVSWKEQTRKECVIPAKTIRVLRVSKHRSNKVLYNGKQ
jgi:putative phage-type endonuclease